MSYESESSAAFWSEQDHIASFNEPTTSMPTIIPTADRILIQIVDDERPESSLILPEGVHVEPHAIALAVGPDVKGVAVGDRLLILPQAPNGPFKMDGYAAVWLLSEHCVIGKLV